MLIINSTAAGKMLVLIRNAHALAKQNRPLSDFVWHCDLNQAKGIEIGHTYHNVKACATFIDSIASVMEDTLVNEIKAGSYLL